MWDIFRLNRKKLLDYEAVPIAIKDPLFQQTFLRTFQIMEIQMLFYSTHSILNAGCAIVIPKHYS